MRVGGGLMCILLGRCVWGSAFARCVCGLVGVDVCSYNRQYSLVLDLCCVRWYLPLFFVHLKTLRDLLAKCSIWSPLVLACSSSQDADCGMVVVVCECSLCTPRGAHTDANAGIVLCTIGSGCLNRLCAVLNGPCASAVATWVFCFTNRVCICLSVPCDSHCGCCVGPGVNRFSGGTRW